MSVVWAGSLLGFDAAGYWTSGWTAAGLLAVITVVFAVGECLHGTIHLPLASDLASPRALGRYLAFSSQSWQIGWIIGPAGGGFLLQHAPYALWPVAAALQLAAAGWALAQRFHWHALDIEDVLSRRQRPKVDDYPEYLFGVLHFPVYDKTIQRLNGAELDFFLGPDYLVTLPNVELLPVTRLFQRCY